MNDYPSQSLKNEAVSQTESINASPSPIHPYQKNNRFILIAVASLLLFVFAILLAYSTFVTKTQQTNTASQSTITTTTELLSQWETYTNHELSFSIDYPEKWEAKALNNDTSVASTLKNISFRPIDPERINEHWGFINLVVRDNLTNLTIDEYISNYFCDSPGVCAFADTAPLITVSGVQGKLVLNPPGPLSSQTAVIIYSDKIFTVTVTLDRSLEKTYSTQQKIEIFNTMFDSLKFLDNEVVNDAAVSDNLNAITLEDIKNSIPPSTYVEKVFNSQEWAPNGYCGWGNPVDCKLLIITDAANNQLIVSSPGQFGILVSDAQECFKDNTETLQLGNNSFDVTGRYHSFEQIKYVPERIGQGGNPYDCSVVEMNQTNFHHLVGCQSDLCFWAQKPFNLMEFNESMKGK